MKNLSTFTTGGFFRSARRGALLLALGAAGPAAWGQSFGPASAYQTLSNFHPHGLAVGDFNGDGHLDAVTANFDSNDISVLLALAGGGFAPAVRYSTGTNSQPWGIAVADINGDGRQDIITANNGSGSAGVLLGQATGFAPVVSYSFASGGSNIPIGIAMGDMNADGQPDAVVANYGSGAVVVLPGMAGGGFAAAASYSTGSNSSPYGLALGDVNNDGRLDVVSASYYENKVVVQLGLASGGLGTATAYATGTTGTNPGPRNVALGDVNRDGRLDMVVANYLTGAVSVLLGQASGGFLPPTLYVLASNAGVQDVKLGDVNGDGWLDIVASRSNPTGVGVLLGRSTGGFATTVTFSTGIATDPFSIVLADMNQDGRLDIVDAGYYLTNVGVLLNTGTYTPLATARPTAADVSLYPNPAHDAFRVQLPAGFAPNRAELLNALGQVVRRPAVGGTSFQVETSGLAPGLYTLRLLAGGTALARRVVVE